MSSLNNLLFEYYNGGNSQNGIIEAEKLKDPKKKGIWKARFALIEADSAGIVSYLLPLELQKIDNYSPEFMEITLLKILAFAINQDISAARTLQEKIEETYIDNDWVYMRGLKAYTDGVLNILEGHLENAAKELKEARVLLEKTRFQNLLIKALLNLGTVHVYSDELEKAEEIYYEALLFALKIKNETLQFKSHFNLLTVLYEKGNIAGCIAYDRLLSPKDNLSTIDIHDLIEYNSLIGLCCKLEGNYEDSIKLFEETILLAKNFRIQTAFSFLLSEMSIIHFELGDLERSMMLISEAILFCSPTDNPEDLFLLEMRKKLIESEVQGNFEKNTVWEQKMVILANQISFRFLLPEKMFQILLTMLNLDLQTLEEKINEGISTFENRFANSPFEPIQMKIQVLKTKAYLNQISHQSLIDLRDFDRRISLLENSDRRLLKMTIILEIQIRLLEFRMTSREETSKKITKLITQLLNEVENDSSIQFRLSSKILSSKVFWLFKEITKSIKLFDEALDLAKSSGLKHQFTLLQNEKTKMITEVKEWRDISLSLEQQLKVYEKADLIKYAQKVSRILSHLMG